MNSTNEFSFNELKKDDMSKHVVFFGTPDWIRTSDLQSRSSCRKSVYALKTRGVGNCADCFEVISDACQTIPILISTSSATITTSAEIMKPWIMGRMPAFFMLAKEVFRPMAAKAQTIRNLLMRFVPDTTAAGIGNTLATTDIARKPRINQGKILEKLKNEVGS